MKLFWKILKYVLLISLALLIIAIFSLLSYYDSLYKESPPLSDVKALKLISPDTPRQYPVLLPEPRQLIWTNESYALTSSNSFQFDAADGSNMEDFVKKFFKNNALEDSGLSIAFKENTELQDQEYLLNIKSRGIEIQYHKMEGVFYALTTLKQMLLQAENNQLSGVEISDKPDLQIRGAMLDISRNKIPKLETLFGIVDFLADLKYNHLQLYIEGLSFAYPSFQDIWQETETPITPEEMQQLDQYCKERLIDLVPNQNSLGHMMSWLETEEYQDLAECPDGYKLLGLLDMKGTLNPGDPRSLALVKKMSKDLLPNFSSGLFNVNLDEPFELGECRSKALAEEKGGAEQLYLDYTLKLHEFVKAQGKTMMMWGDVVSKHPEIISEIPNEIIMLEWGYEFNHPFAQNCERFQKDGQPFMVCPGTSTWSSFTGRTTNMMGNVENAVSNAIKFGAEGMLITDWGDFGHLQYLPMSYAGLAYGAALSWNYESKDSLALGNYLSSLVFQDEQGLMGNLILNMGTYNQFEEYPMVAGTTTGFAINFGFMDKVVAEAINRNVQPEIMKLLSMPEDIETFFIDNFRNPKPYNHQAVLNLADSLTKALDQLSLTRKDAKLILDECKNGLLMVKLGAKVKHFNNYQLQHSQEENLTLLQEMKSLCAQIIPEHERLWMQRNKPGRLDLSLSNLNKLQNQIEDKIKEEEKTGFVKWINRSIQKITSAGAALYLR